MWQVADSGRGLVRVGNVNYTLLTLCRLRADGSGGLSIVSHSISATGMRGNQSAAQTWCVLYILKLTCFCSGMQQSSWDYSLSGEPGLRSPQSPLCQLHSSHVCLCPICYWSCVCQQHRPHHLPLALLQAAGAKPSQHASLQLKQSLSRLPYADE